MHSGFAPRGWVARAILPPWITASATPGISRSFIWARASWFETQTRRRHNAPRQRRNAPLAITSIRRSAALGVVAAMPLPALRTVLARPHAVVLSAVLHRRRSTIQNFTTRSRLRWFRSWLSKRRPLRHQGRLAASRRCATPRRTAKCRLLQADELPLSVSGRFGAEIRPAKGERHRFP